MIQVGDIVRVILCSTPMSTHKRHLINETGIVVERPNTHIYGKSTEEKVYLVQFFHTGERVIFHYCHLIKEEDWVNRRKRSI